MTLLQDSLGPLEVQLLVCTRCSGVMNESCYYKMISETDSNLIEEMAARNENLVLT